MTELVGFIDEYRCDYGVESICETLQMAQSSYYDAKARELSPSAQANFAQTQVSQAQQDCARAEQLMATNAIAICSGMLPFALVKLALPFAAVRQVVDRVLMALAQGWVAGNGWWMALVQRIRWDVEGLEGVRR